MSVRGMISHVLAVAALGAMCMAQSTTEYGTQSTDQQSTDQQRMEQQNNENGAPANMNQNDTGVNETNPGVQNSVDEGAFSNNGIDTVIQRSDDRGREIENENGLTSLQQQGNN